MKRLWIVAVIAIALLAFGVSYAYTSKPVVEPSESVQAPVVATLSKYEVGPADPQEILELVNAEREKAGVAPLVMHDSLNKSAQLKADDMWNRDYRGHYLPEDPNATLTLEMYSYVEPYCESSSENLSFSTDGSDLTSDESIRWWMNSPPHKKAILDPVYTLTGIGVSNGSIAVQRFCIAK